MLNKISLHTILYSSKIGFHCLVSERCTYVSILFHKKHAREIINVHKSQDDKMVSAQINDMIYIVVNLNFPRIESCFSEFLKRL